MFWHPDLFKADLFKVRRSHVLDVLNQRVQERHERDIKRRNEASFVSGSTFVFATGSTGNLSQHQVKIYLDDNLIFDSKEEKASTSLLYLSIDDYNNLKEMEFDYKNRDLSIERLR